MHGCMVYTECALRRQQFHVAPEQPCYNQTATKWVFKMAFFECFLCWHLGFIAVTRMRNIVGSQVLRLFLILECTTEAAYWMFIFSTLSNTKSFRKMVLQRMLSVVCLSFFAALTSIFESLGKQGDMDTLSNVAESRLPAALRDCLKANIFKAAVNRYYGIACVCAYVFKCVCVCDRRREVVCISWCVRIRLSMHVCVCVVVCET